MSVFQPRIVRLIGSLALLVLMSVAPSLAFGQGATPAMTMDEGHPVHVHQGTCAELNPQPLYMLTNITAPTGTDAPGTGAPVAVETSTTTIDAPLSELTGGNHAINAHESVENIANYIACGDIGGTVITSDAGDSISIGLHELNGSGYSGVAVLQASGQQTIITIYLAQGLSGAAAATPVAAANQGTQATSADVVQVKIANLAYSPETVTIKAGQSVTWTNDDTVPHTVTAKDRNVLQSGTMNAGDTFTQTFNTPGTYEYFCEFHANMKGVVIVK